MDWFASMARAMDYVEANLEGEIDCAAAARLAGCSSYNFQRMFAFIAGVTLAEYIRRRRMTLAGIALRQGARVMPARVMRRLRMYSASVTPGMNLNMRWKL